MRGKSQKKDMHPLKPLARDFRKRQTDTENILWVHLRNRQIQGVKFRRQVPIGNYIVDFISIQHKLIIEIDGGQHNEEMIKDYDSQRTKFLEDKGYKVIRVWNNEITENLAGVLEVLHLTLLRSLSSRRGK